MKLSICQQMEARIVAPHEAWMKQRERALGSLAHRVAPHGGGGLKQ